MDGLGDTTIGISSWEASRSSSCKSHLFEKMFRLGEIETHWPTMLFLPARVRPQTPAWLVLISLSRKILVSSWEGSLVVPSRGVDSITPKPWVEMPSEPVTTVRTPCALALPGRAKRARRKRKAKRSTMLNTKTEKCESD